AERADVARLVRELRGVRETLRMLVAEEREAARLQDRLNHEVAEIDAAGLREDEEAELLAQRTRLQHVERLQQAAVAAYQALAGDDDEMPGAVDLLGRAVATLEDAGHLDRVLASGGEALTAALRRAEESGRWVGEY